MKVSVNWGSEFVQTVQFKQTSETKRLTQSSCLHLVSSSSVLFAFLMTFGFNLTTFSIAYFLLLRIRWEFVYEFGRFVVTYGKTLPRVFAVESVKPREENISG
jgi:hypothetical protein